MAKWEPCLKLIKEPDTPDIHFVSMNEKMKTSIAKKLEKDGKHKSLRQFYGYE